MFCVDVTWTIIDPAPTSINYHRPKEPNFKQSDEELLPSPASFPPTASDRSSTTLRGMPASSTPADDNPSAPSVTAAGGGPALPEVPLIVQTPISSAEWSAMSSAFRYLSPAKSRLDWPAKTPTQPTPNSRRTVQKPIYQGSSGLQGWRFFFARHFVPRADVAPCQQVRHF